jgi:hypothetical protein
MIEYLKNEKISELINKSPSYRKSAETLLRLPHDSEINQKFLTYVKHDNTLRVESTNTVNLETIIARNPEIIGSLDSNQIYNEWLITQPVAIKNYGAQILYGLTNQFKPYKKFATIKALEITPSILQTLGVSGDTLNIKVTWSPEPMIAKLGDYLTDSGYSISKNDMTNTYEIVK